MATLTSDISAPWARLLVIGFHGNMLTPFLTEWLPRGLGGVILFSRNVGSPAETVRVTQTLRAASPHRVLLCVDQEGGRVARLRAGYSAIPSMRAIGQRDDAVSLARQVGRVLGREVRASGFDVNFAPVLDVDSNPANPVIGDRAFGSDPAGVAACGAALATGLAETGVIGCGKHFPGHGDTRQDSHLELPTLEHDLARLEAIELVPFRAAIKAYISMIMMAHVRFPAIDAEHPATLSPAVLAVLRRNLGFNGIVVSDCLEMAAVAQRYGMAEAIERGLDAGIDLFICSQREDRQLECLRTLERLWATRREQMEQSILRVTRLCACFGPPPALSADEVTAICGQANFDIAPPAGHDPTEPTTMA